MPRIIVLYSGRVQGVGFRAAVRRLACGYEVTGAVRNLSDGRVELVAEGTHSELEAFLAGIDASDLSDLIAGKSVAWREAQGNLRGFMIAP